MKKRVYQRSVVTTAKRVTAYCYLFGVSVNETKGAAAESLAKVNAIGDALRALAEFPPGDIITKIPKDKILENKKACALVDATCFVMDKLFALCTNFSFFRFFFILYIYYIS